ncbi:glutathione S-transferase family protein [Microcoleus sp. FACHB-831]|uniref:glutathione S-transferase family protein n=1 Tax=Microcoleus sp. FACHB-831 TaxID=2692827 RepID=UPI001689BC10|nr:glutathione S-transferase family protein [Microcoleus sp. FACHB-831]MBD1921298.1 glutathione S-transferase family protein [Microcoleus sp. FACHB-831]
MLTLYHEPVSPNSRRVWITLILKGLEFELVELKLNGEQFNPDFLAINPFHHIPALVDDGFNIVESLAILDYLEAKYPTPAMLPKDAKDLAIVRMVQLVTANELLPGIAPLFPQMLGFPGGDPEKIEQAHQKVATVLKFFENLLGNRPYFGSENITLADVVAGTVIPWLSRGGVSLSDYPKLSAWCDRLMANPAWQATEATPEAIENIKSIMAARMAR